jgi:hypothetical protein
MKPAKKRMWHRILTFVAVFVAMLATFSNFVAKPNNMSELNDLINGRKKRNRLQEKTENINIEFGEGKIILPEIKDVVMSHPTIGDVTFKGVNVSDLIENGMEYYEVPTPKELENQIADALALSGGNVKVYKKRSIGCSGPCPINLVNATE